MTAQDLAPAAEAPLHLPHLATKVMIYMPKSSMTQDILHLLHVLAVALLLPLAMCRAADADSAEATLVQLADQYRLPLTLHCKATTITDYKTIPPGIFHVEGIQEYWADGPKYRILQLRDSSVFPGMSQDVRWNGEQFQWFNVGDATLLYSMLPSQKTPYIGEPLPLLPMEFLNPGGKQRGVRLSLDELRSESVRSRLHDAALTGSDGATATFPGGKVGDTDYTFRIEFAGSPAYLPTTIMRISGEGIALDTDEIQYQPVQCTAGVFYLPRWTRTTNRTFDGRIACITTCTATLIEADVPIPPEMFTVDFQRARSVINLDRYSQPVRSSAVKGVAPPTPPVQLSVSSDTRSNSEPDSIGGPAPLMDSVGHRASGIVGTVVQLLAGVMALMGGLALVWKRKIKPVGSR